MMLDTLEMMAKDKNGRLFSFEKDSTQSGDVTYQANPSQRREKLTAHLKTLYPDFVPVVTRNETVDGKDAYRMTLPGGLEVVDKNNRLMFRQADGQTLDTEKMSSVFGVVSSYLQKNGWSRGAHLGEIYPGHGNEAELFEATYKDVAKRMNDAVRNAGVVGRGGDR